MSWDIGRNHFSKAYNLAEALDLPTQVQLLGFRFFEERVFQPYAEAEPAFTTCFLPGEGFPEWSRSFAKAVAAIRGDVVYAVKPRLPSLGVALLANYHFGTPVVLELNDLESAVTNPKRGDLEPSVQLSEVDPADARLRNPYGDLWTSIMEGLAPRVPYRASHNRNLDERFGGGSFRMRNPKDDKIFDPDRHDRNRVRRRLGFGPGDRVILFGGMVRRHKGVMALARLLQNAEGPYRLLVVGSRETKDQQDLRELVGDKLTILDPVDRNGMAEINAAADAVVLWLDPDVPASHYQMPYKLTDALAMKVPVLANDISDLGELGRRGYLRLVDYGDERTLLAELDRLFAEPRRASRTVEAGRRLYLREFSYSATKQNLDLILRRLGGRREALPVAEEFADFFTRFRVAQAARQETTGS